ncbi:MAG: thiamine phosphate synthase [Bacteroidetes bacterium]|nr:thiamine phosphate synthase [Bacteroidota bacterium]
MKLIVISNSGTTENEAQIITSLFEAGLENFHLRKHKLSTKETRALLKKIPDHFHDRIILHSHHKLARAFNLRGIHLTKTHIKRNFKTWLILKLIQFKNPDIVVTTSFNNIGQLFEKDHRHSYNYIFLSPIFDSLNSKFQGGFTEHSLRSAIQKTSIDVIARGGVDISSIEKAYAIGFQGLAFYSSIWKNKDPLAEFNRIVEKFQELKIPIE